MSCSCVKGPFSLSLKCMITDEIFLFIYAIICNFPYISDILPWGFSIDRSTKSPTWLIVFRSAGSWIFSIFNVSIEDIFWSINTLSMLSLTPLTASLNWAGYAILTVAMVKTNIRVVIHFFSLLERSPTPAIAISVSMMAFALGRFPKRPKSLASESLT